MLRTVANSLFRSARQGARSAIVYRQPQRNLEDLSYSKDFNVVKRVADEERIKSRKDLDESRVRIRDAAEGAFQLKGVTISAYSEVSLDNWVQTQSIYQFQFVRFGAVRLSFE